MSTFLLRCLNKQVQRLNLQQNTQLVYYGSVHKVIFKRREQFEAETAANEAKFGKHTALDRLQELLRIPKFHALNIVLKHKPLWELPRKVFTETHATCQKYNLPNEALINYPLIFMTDKLEERLQLIALLPHDMKDKAPLLLMSFTQLQRLVQREKKMQFLIIYVSTFKRVLEMSTVQFYEIISKKVFLMSIGLNRFEETTKLLLDLGVSRDEIRNDMWVYQYSLETIERRINTAHENGIEKAKTWMVRGKAIIFENYIKRRSDNKLILGDNTVAEYLAERLACTVSAAIVLIQKQPALQNKSLKKMENIIDFLYSYGFKPYHICRVPKILLHSVETTRKRIRELERQGLNLESLHILTKSKKQYLQFYEALVKSNKSKLKPEQN